jgi:exodeoxyribonuclease VII large subunit
MIERPLRAAQERLAALSRLASQLHPEKPLERGYAIIRTASGDALTTRAEAAREAALKVQFRDGTLDVAPHGGQPGPTKTKAKARQSGAR